jgi:PTS system cellobiose-specific IIA component
MAHDVPLGCAPDEYDDLISGTCSHLPLEEAVMEIIVNAGQSRSLCFEALHGARQRDEAKSLLREADGYARQAAHKMQTKLIEQGCGRRPPADDVNYGARRDHLMNSLLARELSENYSFISEIVYGEIITVIPLYPK